MSDTRNDNSLADAYIELHLCAADRESHHP